MGTEPVQDNHSDDQELAKALAGMNDAAASPVAAGPGLVFEETPALSGPVSNSPFSSTAAADDKPADPPPLVVPQTPEPPTQGTPTSLEPVSEESTLSEPEPAQEPTQPSEGLGTTGNPDLDNIKKDALNELRPLVGKLTVGPEERFDTYLLLLRSTDDASLIGPAHEAAKEIPDETRRAQALLDVIKEIDYLASHKN